MRRLLPGVVLVAAALSACTSSADAPAPSSSRPATTPSVQPSSAPVPPKSSVPSASGHTQSSTPARSLAQRTFDAMTEAQRVGQLLMVDCSSSGASAATTSAITDAHVGSVILDGTSTAGASAFAAVTARLRALAPHDVGLFVATDQEGGEVQRLQGPGFDTIPSAVQQGTIAPATLRQDARSWGQQLRAVGVNVNLAPVLDTVPAGFGSNPPIGDLDREYGNTPSVVAAHGLAVVHGMEDAGVDPVVKHFPGLGRVHGNTDTTSGVTDTVTTADDPYLAPFRAAMNAHVPFVMISTAIYARLDPDVPAAFSKAIITGLLRNQFGFGGLVISDDLGAARQVSGYSVGQRAVDFVAAGGDVVLTVDASQAGTMTAALLAKAQASQAFRQQVDAAALRVLQAKEAAGLLR